MAHLLGVISYLYALSAASIIAYVPTLFLPIDRPVHLALLTLLTTNVLLLLCKHVSRPGASAHSHQRGQYTSIPLQDLQNGDTSPVQDMSRPCANGLSLIALLSIMCGGIIALTLRIEILRQISLAPECATRSREIWLPFLVAVYDAVMIWYVEQNHDKTVPFHNLSLSPPPNPSWSHKAMMFSSLLRYVPAALLLSFGCHLVAGLWYALRSTLICPLNSPDAYTVPALQWLALFFDTGLAISALQLGHARSRPTRPLLSIPGPWIIVTTVSAGVWMTVFVFVYSLQPENRAWLLLSLENSRVTHIVYLLCQVAFLSSFCVATLYSVIHKGLVDVSMVLTTIFVVIPGLRFIWSTTRPYPVLSPSSATWSFLIVYASWLFFSYTKKSIVKSDNKRPSLTQLVALFVLIGLLYPVITKTNMTDHHPIDVILQRAHEDHSTYLKSASRSKSLPDAVRVYQQRYGDVPPPGFDVWFQFAQNRSVWVIDEFDQIHRDLLPFRAFAPAQLRSRTWELVSDNSSGVCAIKIRNGHTSIQDGVVPTHRWMLEGVVRIIDNFSQYLPDMDIGFSLSDEARVAVPFSELQKLQEQANKITFQGTSTSATHGPGTWKEIPEQPIEMEEFEDWSLRNIYQEWAAATCPPTSAARTKAMPLYKSRLCLDCTTDHTIGQFLSNWTKAADPCHQPDLATSHGFFLSPASFKSTRQLYPIFSQSKPGGFNDIIYPSAWNYVDKVAYAPTDTGTDGHPAHPDPQFEEKRNILFWRGGTTEGISDGHGAWRGMVRQRMVHLTNNLTTSGYDSTELLLPNHGENSGYTYTEIPRSSLPSLGLNADVRFVNEIARCGGRDCSEQINEFGLSSPVDFQSHWTSKYLIDLDGAGFSGRFLPFLRSRSVPFKSALFREWYDSRLTPWVHFVPIDMRLHGLWSTLAYFTGVRGTDHRGRLWNWPGHEDKAKAIAEAGREWSNKVLTKNDMEVYMFRLLLEWARLTDDRRLELGYSLD